MRKQSGFVGWSKQDEIARSLYEHRRVTVRASHGPGKTAVAGALVDDFMSLGPCRIVTTAPTWPQVETLLWAEINQRVRQARIPWGKKPTKTMWKIRDDWAAYGFSTDQPERFQGHHGRRVLLVVDEASGVDERIFEAGMGFLTGEESYVLYLGNPTRMTGSFYRSHQPDSGFHRISISTFDCPAFTGEEVSDELRWSLPSKQWEEWARAEWGVESPEYRVRVLGEFANLIGRPYFKAAHIDQVEPVAPRRRGFLTGDAHRGGSVEFHDQPDGELRIWHARREGRKYVVFADVAGQVRAEDWEQREESHRGSGDDYCAAQVLDVQSGEQVAELQARIDPDVYAEALVRLCWVYRDDERTPCWLGVESNAMGQATLAVLKRELRFRRLWRRQRLENARSQSAPALGLVTNRDTRERMIASLRATLREAPGRIHSEWLVQELRSFVYHDNGYGAAGAGTHDDLVISMAGALEMRDQVLRRPGSDEGKAA
jgi:hypothetical protein